LATSTLQPSTSANEDNLHLWQKQVFDATEIITGELEEQPLKPNSNLGYTPLYFYA
jgi:dTDP-glucose pyrophosphorylase